MTLKRKKQGFLSILSLYSCIPRLWFGFVVFASSSTHPLFKGSESVKSEEAEFGFRDEFVGVCAQLSLDAPTEDESWVFIHRLVCGVVVASTC